MKLRKMMLCIINITLPRMDTLSLTIFKRVPTVLCMKSCVFTNIIIFNIIIILDVLMFAN